MSEDLVNLARRWPERVSTHYEGCEADHVGCLVKKLADQVERLRAEVERVKQERDDHRAEFERLVVERDAHRFEVERLTAELTNAKIRHNLLGMKVEAERDAARAEVERLTQERDEARDERDAVQRERDRVQDLLTLAGRELSTLREALRVRKANPSDQRDKALAWVKRLTHQNIERLKNAIDHLTSERDEARAEFERLKRMLPPTTHTGLRNGPGEGSWSVFAGTVVEERDEAREEVERLNAEVERLTAERDEARAELARVQMQYIDDEFAKVTAKVINRHQRECDHACQQVDRLQQTGADRSSDQSAQNLDMVANCKETLTSSRPTDEDIWREAFMSQLHDRYGAASELAEVALAGYRKRWPR